MDKYQPVRVIGEGSFGKVYLMQDKVQRKLLCVKVIKIKNIPKKERDATKLEVDLLRRLHHPNIVRYVDSFLSKNQDSLCIAMEVLMYIQVDTIYEFSLTTYFFSTAMVAILRRRSKPQEKCSSQKIKFCTGLFRSHLVFITCIPIKFSIEISRRRTSFSQETAA
jgi:serine/threonine protein kinase